MRRAEMGWRGGISFAFTVMYEPRERPRHRLHAVKGPEAGMYGTRSGVENGPVRRASRPLRAVGV